MLKIDIINYPEAATSSSIELVPEAELAAPEHFWVSELPIGQTHIFDIDRGFYPVRITLFIIQAGYELLYMFQGTHPDEPDYKEVLFDGGGSFTYDVANDIWAPQANWLPYVVGAAVIVAAAWGTVELTRKKR